MSRLIGFEMPVDVVSQYVNSRDGLRALLDPRTKRGGASTYEMKIAEAQDILEVLLATAGRRYLSESDARLAFDDLSGGGFGIRSWAVDEIMTMLRPISIPAPGLPDPIPAEAQSHLGVYVYALVDPRDGTVFYVGKGKRNRVYQHAWAVLGGQPVGNEDIVGSLDTASVASAKNARIAEIDSAGFGVEHWIIRHSIEAGSPDAAALAAEQAMIDILKIAGRPLTNLKGGHVDTVYGALPTDELVLRYSAVQIDPSELPRPHVLLKVNAASDRTLTSDEIYEAARRSWRAGPIRDIERLPVFVFADDIVRAVYLATGWVIVSGEGKDRLWEYTGHPDPELEIAFVGKGLRRIRAERADGKWRQHGWHPYL